MVFGGACRVPAAVFSGQSITCDHLPQPSAYWQPPKHPLVAAAGGDNALAAKRAGLVDEIRDEEAVAGALRALTGADD